MSADANALYHDPALAGAYARVTAGNVANDAYERPAVRALVGDPAGLDVLDAGCAAGDHAAWLAALGARVVALDGSETMVMLARERLAGAAPVVLADLRERLPFPNGAFDLVVSSLTLHYLEEWGAPLCEFARVLRSGGRLICSTHHPFATALDVADYHAVQIVEETWSGFAPGGVAMRFYHRPLQRIVDDFCTAGFVVLGMHEPQPTPAADGRDAAFTAQLRMRPGFLVLDARRA